MEGLYVRTVALGDPAAVRDDREGVRSQEEADAPGQRDPDVGADGLLREQAADRVDDRRDRLVLGEGAHRAGHRRGEDERRADERQEDQRVGERARPVDGLRRQAGDDGQPGQRHGEQEQDAGDREPREHSRTRAEAHEQGDEHDHRERDEGRDDRGEHVRPQDGRPRDRHGLEALEQAALHVHEQAEGGVGDARRDGDEQDAGEQVVHVRVRTRVHRAAEHVDEQQHERDRHDRRGDDGVGAAGDVTQGPAGQERGVVDDVRGHG